LSDAWICHRNSVAEIELIICNHLRWGQRAPAVRPAGTCGAASGLRRGELGFVVSRPSIRGSIILQEVRRVG
jgi:hypothetical protein